MSTYTFLRLSPPAPIYDDNIETIFYTLSYSYQAHIKFAPRECKQNVIINYLSTIVDTNFTFSATVDLYIEGMLQIFSTRR